MNKKYVPHPGDYAVGENEKLYTDMAAKGWILEKRGARSSRFRKEEPQRLRYRLEFARPALENEEKTLPEEQVSLYEECGWTYVTSRGLVHVFSAPEDSGVPELHTDPRQQAGSVRVLLRNYLGGWLAFSAMLLLYALLHGPSGKGLPGSFFGTLTTLRMSWVEATAPMLLYALLLLVILSDMLYGTLRTYLLYRRLKRGQPLDHSPQKRRWALRTASALLWLCMLLFAVLSILQLAGKRAYELPEPADGPYLTLRDLGFTGEHNAPAYTGSGNEVKHSRSLMAEMWDTSEYLTTENGDCWMYQDVYRLRSPEAARAFAPVLMNTSLFARSEKNFERVAVEGLDLAYRSGLEYVAVRGNMVYYIKYMESGLAEGEEPKGDVLGAIAGMGR